MPLSKPGPVLEKARNNQYLVGAFFVFNSDSLTAVMEAAATEQSPVIVQVGMQTREHQPSLSRFVSWIKQYAEESPVPVVLQHDHCPTLEDCRIAVESGIRSVMFDGSALPYLENVRQTREAVVFLHQHGGWLEAELGRIPGNEAGELSSSAYFTDPDQAAEFVQLTGCDSLAVAVGTTHGGIAADNDLWLDFDLLQRIRDRLPAGYPLVLHGAASLPQGHIDFVNQYGGQVERLRMVAEENISKTAQLGVCKANMDVDNFLCYTGAMRKFLTEQPQIYNPVPIVRAARDAFSKDVARKIREVLRSAGQA